MNSCVAKIHNNFIYFIGKQSNSFQINHVINDDKRYGTMIPNNGSYFTYSILNNDYELTDSQAKKATAYAFKAWELRINTKFKKARPEDIPDFKISFRSEEEDELLDKNTLAYMYFPIQNRFAENRGLCVINKRFYWDSSGNGVSMHIIDPEHYNADTIVKGVSNDLDQVLRHEFGHGLGLPHDRLQGNIMSSNYGFMSEFLTKRDIERVQAKYGKSKRSKHIIERFLSFLFHRTDRY